MQAVAIPVYRLLRLASGCFLFCTREAFCAVGGFDIKLYAAEEAAMSRALGRQGRFVILREFVITSGRKLRTYSGCEILGVLIRLALAGKKVGDQARRTGYLVWRTSTRSTINRNSIVPENGRR
jgi:hypothetical protein